VTALTPESLQNKAWNVVDIGEAVPNLVIVSATNSTNSTTAPSAVGAGQPGSVHRQR
jgi:hypothetical protein